MRAWQASNVASIVTWNSDQRPAVSYRLQDRMWNLSPSIDEGGYRIQPYGREQNKQKLIADRRVLKTYRGKL